MALIIRIDVDRPYGVRPALRHILSRVSSDLYFPEVERLGYLAELRTMLSWLSQCNARAHVFFRRCTLPSREIMEVIEDGGHEIGLHLENSRSFASFRRELDILEQRVNKRVRAVSKHGSGGGKFGLRHYAPYEPDRYLEWAERACMRLLLGNLENPLLERQLKGGLSFFPGAFWLEPHWRDTRRFTVDWLEERALHDDIVLLVHPENVLSDPLLTADFKRLSAAAESVILS